LNKELQIKDQSELGCRWQCEAPVILSPFLELEAKEEEKAGYAQTSATESVDDCIYINSLARKKKPVVQPSSNLSKAVAENIPLKEKIMSLEKEKDKLQSRLEKKQAYQHIRGGQSLSETRLTKVYEMQEQVAAMLS